MYYLPDPEVGAIVPGPDVIFTDPEPFPVPVPTPDPVPDMLEVTCPTLPARTPAACPPVPTSSRHSGPSFLIDPTYQQGFRHFDQHH